MITTFIAHQQGHTVNVSSAPAPAEFRRSLYRYAGQSLVALLALLIGGGLVGG